MRRSTLESIAWNAVRATLVLLVISRLQGSDGLNIRDETMEEDSQKQTYHDKQTEELEKGPAPLGDSYAFMDGEYQRVRVERTATEAAPGATNSTATSLHVPSCGALFTFMLLAL